MGKKKLDSKHCIIRDKKLLKKAKKHFQLCLAPLETPHRGTFLLMTLAQPAADDAKPDIYAIMYQKPK